MTLRIEGADAPELDRERVILVDHRDVAVGTAGKLAAHRAGLLHRAFSVFVLNPAGEMLLQRRASGKYHSGGLWSNACCGHPRPGEDVAAAAGRRLGEELGFGCALRTAGSFRYRAELGAGLTEHEIDHLFVGLWDGRPDPDPAEVSDWRWAALPGIRRELDATPDRFTAWFRAALEALEGRGLLERADSGG